MMLLTCNFAIAATHYVPYRETGIITKDIATNLYMTDKFAINSTGELLVCVHPFSHSQSRDTCTDIAGKNAWKLATALVPSNKTYVGFNITRGILTIYWK